MKNEIVIFQYLLKVDFQAHSKSKSFHINFPITIYSNRTAERIITLIYDD